MSKTVHHIVGVLRDRCFGRDVIGIEVIAPCVPVLEHIRERVAEVQAIFVVLPQPVFDASSLAAVVPVHGGGQGHTL